MKPPIETYTPPGDALPSLRMADLRRAERTRRDLAKWQDHMRIMEEHHKREAAQAAAQASSAAPAPPARRTRKAKP